jgi:hypothetical protein
MATPSDLWARCFDAAVARLAEIEPGGIPAERVYKQKLPDLSNVKYPCLIVSKQGVAASFDILDTGSDDTTLGVAVSAWDRQSARDASGMDDWLSLAVQIGAAFRARSMSSYGVPEAWRVDAVPMTPLDAARALGPGYMQATGGLVLRFRCITSR